jgi:hypothetical protein
MVPAADVEIAAEGVSIAQAVLVAVADDDEAAMSEVFRVMDRTGEGYAVAALMCSLGEALRPMVKADRTWFSRRLLGAVGRFESGAVIVWEWEVADD